MINISNHKALAEKLEKLIEEDVNEDTELKVSHDDWRVIVKALQENYALKLLIETIHVEAGEPLSRPLEVGFRHISLTEKEIKERLFETCEFIALSTKAILDSIEERR